MMRRFRARSSGSDALRHMRFSVDSITNIFELKFSVQTTVFDTHSAAYQIMRYFCFTSSFVASSLIVP